MMSTNNNNNNSIIMPRINAMCLNISLCQDETKRKKKLREAYCIADKYQIDIMMFCETNQYVNNDAKNDRANTLVSDSTFVYKRADALKGVRGVAVAVRRGALAAGDAESKLRVVYHDVGVKDAAGDDDSGRRLIVECELATGESARVGVLYFPASGIAQRKRFINTLPAAEFARCMVIGTDSNLHTLPSDTPNNKPTTGDGVVFKQWLARLKFGDVGELLSPNGAAPYTWRRPNSEQQGTIDRMLMPIDVVPYVTSFDVVHFSGSDHDAVLIGMRHRSTRTDIKPRAFTQALNDDKVQAAVVELVAMHRAHRRTTPAAGWSGLMSAIATYVDKWYRRSFNGRRELLRKKLVRECRTLRKELGDHATTAARKMTLRARLQQIAHDMSFLNRTTKHTIERELERHAHDTHRRVDQLCKVYDEQQSMTISALRMAEGSVSNDAADIERRMIDTWHAKMNTTINEEPEVREAATRRVLDTLHTHQQLHDVDGELTTDDLKAAMKTMNVSGPGNDRLDLLLFKRVPALLDELADIWRRRDVDGLPRQWSNARVAFLFKGGEHTDANRYRPISLLCVAFKLITKALQLRIGAAMRQVLNIEQSAFLNDRRVWDAVATVVGAADDAIRHSKPLIIVGIDIAGAYDSLDRRYLFRVLNKLGFADKLVADIEMLHRNTNATLMINGRLQPAFNVQSGIRQGDALSVLLYVVAMMPMFTFVKSRGFVGYKPSNATAPVIGAQHCDDTQLLANSVEQANMLPPILAEFGHASGQCASPSKSIVFVVRAHNADQLIPALRKCVVTTTPQRLLGVWLDSNAQIHDDTWQRSARASMASRIRWRALNLSMFERRLVARTHMMSMFGYVASMSTPPLSICKTIDNQVYRFIPGTFISPPFDVMAGPLVRGGVARQSIGRCDGISASLLAMIAVRYYRMLANNLPIPNKWLWRTALSTTTRSMAQQRKDNARYIADYRAAARDRASNRRYVRMVWSNGNMASHALSALNRCVPREVRSGDSMLDNVIVIDRPEVAAKIARHVLVTADRVCASHWDCADAATRQGWHEYYRDTERLKCDTDDDYAARAAGTTSAELGRQRVKLKDVTSRQLRHRIEALEMTKFDVRNETGVAFDKLLGVRTTTLHDKELLWKLASGKLVVHIDMKELRCRLCSVVRLESGDAIVNSHEVHDCLVAQHVHRPLLRWLNIVLNTDPVTPEQALPLWNIERLPGASIAHLSRVACWFLYVDAKHCLLEVARATDALPEPPPPPTVHTIAATVNKVVRATIVKFGARLHHLVKLEMERSHEANDAGKVEIPPWHTTINIMHPSISNNAAFALPATSVIIDNFNRYF
jgi:hypothetical protein